MHERLWVEVANTNTQNVEVRKQLRHVEKFAERRSWDIMAPGIRHEVGNPAGLPTRFADDDPGPAVKRFDLLALRLQLTQLTGLDATAAAAAFDEFAEEDVDRIVAVVENIRTTALTAWPDRPRHTDSL